MHDLSSKVLDLRAVNVFGPLPVEGVEGFDDGKAGSLDATLGGAFLAGLGFADEEFVQVAGYVSSKANTTPSSLDPLA